MRSEVGAFEANCTDSVDNDSDGTVNDGCARYILSDHLGSTSTIVDRNGATATVRYWPYGATRSTSGTVGTDKLYTGQQQEPDDPALGLYNYGARFYSTTLGRFASVDPIVGSAADPQSWNGYAYVRNNPLVYVDPTGLYLDKPGDAAPRGDFVCNAACRQRQQQNVTGALLYIAAMNRAAAAWTAASTVSAAMPCGARDPGGTASLTTQVLVIGGSAGLAAAADPVPGDEVAIWLGTGVAAAGTAVCVGVNCGGAIYGGIEGAVESLRTLFSSDDGERSIDNPESLRGATPEEIEALIPEGWVKEPTRTGGE